MTGSDHRAADRATESKSNKGLPTGRRGEAAAAAGGAFTLGALGAKLGGVGLAAAGTAVAVPAVAVVGICAVAGGSLGWLGVWAARKAIDSRSARAGSMAEGADDR